MNQPRSVDVRDGPQHLPQDVKSNVAGESSADPPSEGGHAFPMQIHDYKIGVSLVFLGDKVDRPDDSRKTLHFGEQGEFVYQDGP